MIFAVMDIPKTLKIDEEQVIKLKNISEQNSASSKDNTFHSSGSNVLDSILNGGFCPGRMYLFFGANNTGKTQICHQFCVQSSKNSKYVFYLDTENTFRAERIRELDDSDELDSNNILKNIYVSKAMSNVSILYTLNDLETRLKDDHHQVLIIDSINNYFRYEQGEESIPYDSAKEIFMQIINKINEITIKYDLITLATAQITSNFIKNAIVRELPVGNQFLNHFFSEHLYLGKDQEIKNFIHLVNSQNLPEKKIFFRITSDGINEY